MYSVDDVIIYGDMGVCKITGITTPDFIDKKKGQLYYVLKSIFQNCVVYAPVNTAAFMRPIISAKEVEHLIDMIPSIQEEVNLDSNVQHVNERYDAAINTHDCADLIKCAMASYAKKQNAEQQKRKLGLVDEKFMKQVEELLYGEFSLALNIPKDKVQKYIASRVDAINQRNNETAQ